MAQVFLVTVRLAKNPDHNPKDKQTGLCPFVRTMCTDSTGEHHTFATVGHSAGEVHQLWSERGFRACPAQRFSVTRVEEARWVTP